MRLGSELGGRRVVGYPAGFYKRGCQEKTLLVICRVPHPVAHWAKGWETASLNLPRFLTGYTDSIMGAWTFAYDTVKRLSPATQTPVSVNGAPPAVQFFCWPYDSFGNRTAQATSNQAFTNALGAPACQPAEEATFNNAWAHYTVDGTLNTPDNGRNQLTASPAGSFSYDAAGDITSDAAHSYAGPPAGAAWDGRRRAGSRTSRYAGRGRTRDHRRACGTGLCRSGL